MPENDKITWGRVWNFIYIFIVVFCVAFGFMFLWFQGERANDYTLIALHMENISAELYESGDLECSAKFCEQAYGLCGLYSEFRRELTVSFQGQDFYNQSRTQLDSYCDYVHQQCFPRMVEVEFFSD